MHVDLAGLQGPIIHLVANASVHADDINGGYHFDLDINLDLDVNLEHTPRACTACYQKRLIVLNSSYT